MNISQLLKNLAHISKLAKRKKDLSIALKAIESQLKFLMEQKKANSIDVNLMDADEINQLIQSAKQALGEASSSR